MKIKIEVDSGTVEAELLDTPSGQAIYEALPINGSAQLWGDEIYFTIPVESALEDDAKDLVEVGDLGYWPPGKALAIFFGPTPMSTGDDPVPASEVNMVGRIEGDHALLRTVKDASSIKIEKA